MGYTRNMKRLQMKQQWQDFKKSNAKYKNMPLAQFRKFWKDSLEQSADKSVAPEYTKEEQTQLDDMFLEEVIEDEDTAIE